MNLLGVLEGILFVVGDEGITLNQVCEIMDIDSEEDFIMMEELFSIFCEKDKELFEVEDLLHQYIAF